jgi:hypothetical protein
MNKFFEKRLAFLILPTAIFFVNQGMSYAQSKFSKSGKPQDEVLCQMHSAETRGFDDKCINEKNEFLGYVYIVGLEFQVAEDYKKILDQIKSEEYLETLERSDICARKGAKKGDRNHQCSESKKIRTKNIEVLSKNCMDNSKTLMQVVIDNKVSARMSGFLRENFDPNTELRCTATLTFQNKDTLCSLSDKLLGHVTKENIKIFPNTISVVAKRSIGSEVGLYATGQAQISLNSWVRRGDENDWNGGYLVNSEFCSK